MSESAGVAGGFVKVFHFLQFNLVDPVDDHLGNPVPPVKGVRFRAEVDYRDLDLTPVVGIDGAGGVDQPDTVLDRQTAAGPDLGFIPSGKRHGKPGGQQCNFPFSQQLSFGNGSTDIHAGGLGGHIAG